MGLPNRGLSCTTGGRLAFLTRICNPPSVKLFLDENPLFGKNVSVLVLVKGGGPTFLKLLFETRLLAGGPVLPERPLAFSC